MTFGFRAMLPVRRSNFTRKVLVRASENRKTAGTSAFQQCVESRLAAIGCVAMDNAALSRFIERRNHRVNLFGIRFCVPTNPLLQTAEAAADAAVLLRASERLP